MIKIAVTPSAIFTSFLYVQGNKKISLCRSWKSPSLYRLHISHGTNVDMIGCSNYSAAAELSFQVSFPTRNS
jgi:hypothetical protein